MKDSYDFTVKGIAREKVKEFVERHYPSPFERSKLKILTMLGHEPYELEQIWDPLGVPRENIYVIEGEAKPYQILQEVNAYGTNLLPRQPVEEFFKGEGANQRFDGINLDYQGYFNSKKKETLRRIAYNQNLNGKGFLATWFLGRHEDENSQFIRDLENQSTINGGINLLNKIMEKGLDNQLGEIGLDILENTMKRQQQINSGDVRSDFLTEAVLLSFQYPKLNFERHPLIDLLNLKKKYFEYIQDSELFKRRNTLYVKAIEENASPHLEGYLLSKEAFEAVKRCRKKAKAGEKIDLEEEPDLIKDFNFESLFFTLETVKTKLKGFLYAKYGRTAVNEDAINLLANQIVESYVKPYLHIENERFFYHSDKGSPMYLDLNLFEKPAKTNIKWKIDSSGKLIIPESTLKGKKNLGDLLERNRSSMNSFLGIYRKKERETLNSPEPEIQTMPFTKENLYKLIEEGKSDAEISILIPDVKIKSIPSYRAHATMKTKGIQSGRKRKDSNLEQEVLNLDIKANVPESTNKIKLNQITKKEAIEFLKAGYSPEEIEKNFPGSFTKRQLGAFQAHYITMGRELRA